MGKPSANDGWLAGGLRGIIFLLKGDMDHFAKSLGLASPSSNNPCPWCPANRSVPDVPMRYNNFRSDARWKLEICTAVVWRNLGKAKHWIFELMYLSILNVEPDDLHITWLGIAADILGSVMWLLCFEIIDAGRTCLEWTDMK